MRQNAPGSYRGMAPTSETRAIASDAEYEAPES